MTDIAFNGVPATEAIEHLRSKLAVPTRHWDDLLGAPQAKGFTIAGATKMDLVKDHQDSIVEALKNGESISQYRKRFDSVVEGHGWSYNGKRGWRSRVIYDTNLRTAHMAGRWAQIQRNKAKRPYLVYMTAGDERVRDQHRAWRYLVLPIDHPFWSTHYPPNGWGCRCYIISADQKMLDRLGLNHSEDPVIKTSERVNTRTGEIYGDTPVGIDTGWGYNVGQAWLGPDIAFGEKLLRLPKSLRQAVVDNTDYTAMDKAFRSWASVALDSHGRGTMHTIGFLDAPVIEALATRDLTPSTATITLTDHRLRRMLRDLKTKKGINLPEEVLLDLPSQLRNYRAVLLDKTNNGVLFVLDHPTAGRLGKVVISINFKERGDLTNSVRSAGTVPTKALKNEGIYELLAGKL